MSGYTFDKMVSTLGKGRPGVQPKLIGGGAGSSGGSGMIGGQERGMDRKVLRNAFGNSSRDFRGARDYEALKAAFVAAGQSPLLTDYMDISPLTLANPGCGPGCQEFNNIPGESWEQIGNSGSLCGQFRAATSLGDTRVPITGGGKAPDVWWGNVSNPLSGVGKTKNLGDGINFSNNIITEIYSGVNINRSLYQRNGASYSGNPRFVADASDFIRYKKLQAKVRNYNDSSFGGSTGQNAISALARVR